MEPTGFARTVDDPIVGAVDRADATAQFIVADVSRDDCWLSVALEGAADLEEWC